MFAPNSRYYQLATYIVTLPNGRTVSVVRCAVPGSQPLAGYHRRVPATGSIFSPPAI
jgi:hypothetical protein